MNTRIAMLTASVLAICAAALAQDPDPSQSATDQAFVTPIKSPAEQYVTLAERMKFGYESFGLGVRLLSYLHQIGDQTLRCLAGTGDSGAAKALWFRLTAYEKKLTHMPEAEEIAREQYRLIGHTILINETAASYMHAATEECMRMDALDGVCLSGNANFRKAAAWYKLAEKLGDPVSARGLTKLAMYANVDAQAADRDAEALLVKTQSLPDVVETYAYQCRDGQE
ncbi:MAG: hypothetical protein ACREVI_16280 [Steroidobacteraceae bacterium]